MFVPALCTKFAPISSELVACRVCVLFFQVLFICSLFNDVFNFFLCFFCFFFGDPLDFDFGCVSVLLVAL